MSKQTTPRVSDSKRSPQAKQTTKQRKAARRFNKMNARKYYCFVFTLHAPPLHSQDVLAFYV